MPRKAPNNEHHDDDVRRGLQPDDEPTADDLSPETLLGEEQPAHADDALSDVGSAQIGMGLGRDEAELADENPVGMAEAQRLKRKAQEHGSNPNFVEPAEAEELADRQRAASAQSAKKPGS